MKPTISAAHSAIAGGLNSNGHQAGGHRRHHTDIAIDEHGDRDHADRKHDRAQEHSHDRTRRQERHADGGKDQRIEKAFKAGIGPGEKEGEEQGRDPHPDQVSQHQNQPQKRDLRPVPPPGEPDIPARDGLPGAKPPADFVETDGNQRRNEEEPRGERQGKVDGAADQGRDFQADADRRDGHTDRKAAGGGAQQVGPATGQPEPRAIKRNPSHPRAGGGKHRDRVCHPRLAASVKV